MEPRLREDPGSRREVAAARAGPARPGLGGRPDTRRGPGRGRTNPGRRGGRRWWSRPRSWSAAGARPAASSWLASADEAEAVAADILALTIKDLPVRKVLVAPAADIVKEYYLGAILDRASRRIVVMASAEGGVEIEEVARATPEAIHRVSAHPHLGLLDWQARELAFAIGLGGPHLRGVRGDRPGAGDHDARATTPTWSRSTRSQSSGSLTKPAERRERLVCLDAKITLDDSALPRHPELETLRDPDSEDPADAEARALGIAFIRLDGSIGCMVNGAGLAMTTMDLVKRAGGEPANFLDIGGGARADKVAAAMRLILADPNVRAILVNIFGGITRGDEVARGLIEARAVQTRDVPMVVRIVGHERRGGRPAPDRGAFRDGGQPRRGRRQGRRGARGQARRRGEHPRRARDPPASSRGSPAARASSTPARWSSTGPRSSPG